MNDTRAVLITGAAKRLGSSIARAFAQQGWVVILHYNRSLNEAEELAKDLRSKGHKAETIYADLENCTEITELWNQIKNLYPHLNTLINNAAVFENDTLSSINETSFIRHLQTNTLAPILMTRGLQKHLKSNQRGSVVNVLDNRLLASNPDHLSYTLSKAALSHATKMLAMEMAGHVQVNAVAPSVMFHSADQTAHNYEQTRDMNLSNIPVDPVQVAKSIVWLATTPEINGIILPIDGGQSLLAPARDVAFLTPQQIHAYKHILPPQRHSSE